MKKILLTLFSLTLLLSSRAQTILFSEDFNSGSTSQFILNDTSLGSTGGKIDNQWVINNAYTGGTGQGILNISCPSFGGLTLPVEVIWDSHTTSPQPSGIAGYPNSYYLHITDTSARQIGVSNATFIIADNICIPAATNFVKMNSDVNTMGHSNVNLSFWWICGGDVPIYGLVYYSIDGGNSWSLVPYAKYNNSQTWQQAVLSIPQFANQATLRFGFMWVNNVPGPNLIHDPSFAIDDVTITADAPPSCNANFLLYPDSVIQHQWYAINLSTGHAPVTYIWNWGDGTASTGDTPSHIYAGAGMYNICLTLVDSTGCTSTHCDSAKVYRTEGGNTPIYVNVIEPNNTPTATQQLPEANNIQVYPNPSNGDITIAGIQRDVTGEIIITNVLGQTVVSATVSKSDGDNIHLQLPQAAGIYFVHLLSTNGEYVSKVVKE